MATNYATEEIIRLQKEAIARTQGQQASTATPTPPPAPPTTPDRLTAGAIRGVSELLGSTMDIPTAVASMAGVGKPTQAGETIAQGIGEAVGVDTAIPEDLEGDLVVQATSGFVQGAPFGAPFGPVGMLTAGTLGALSNVILTRDYFDDKPLQALMLGMVLPGQARSGAKARAPSAGFDPNRPLTRAEQELAQGGSKTSARVQVASESSPSWGNIEQLAARSKVVEKSLQKDLGILDGEPLSPDQVKILGDRITNKVQSLRANFSKINDAQIAKIDDNVRLPIDSVKTRLGSLADSPGTLSDGNAIGAVKGYIKSFDNVKSVSPKTLMEEIKRLNEIGFGKVKFEESAFFAEYSRSNPELIAKLKAMPKDTRETFFKTMAMNMNNAIGDMANVEGLTGKTARQILDFKRDSGARMAELKRIENAPIVKFFGDDYADLDASQLANKLTESSTEEVRTFASLIRKSNPDAYHKLRRLAFEDFMKAFKVGEANGYPIYDFKALSDPEVVKKLRTNKFLSVGGESVELSKTIETLGNLSRKYDADVVGMPATTTAGNQQIVNGLLVTARAVDYKAGIFAQGLERLTRGLLMRNPKSLALFNANELKLIRKSLNGQNVTKEDAKVLADKIETISNVLTVSPQVTTATGLAGQPQPEAGGMTTEKILELQKQSAPTAPTADIPFGA